MIAKILVLICLFFYFPQKSTLQVEKKPLYILFKSNLSKGRYKSNNSGVDIYNYSYISKNGKKTYSLMLFTPKSNANIVIGKSELNKHVVIPYDGLENIKGLISDSWDDNKINFKKVFLIECVGHNKYKIIEVKLYFPFNSEGVKIKINP